MSIGKLGYDYKKYLFPEDWKEYELSQLLEVIERPVDMVDEKEYDLITVKRNFGGIQNRGKFTGKEILVKSQFQIREGDFIISKRQIVHGACAVVPKKYAGATVSNEYDVMNFNNRLLPLFFNYYVQLPFMKRYFYIASDGVHVEKLRFKTSDWLRQKIRVPSIIEQQNIVSVLATSDRNIGLKEQLIAEKKQLKKWLMQNLLTGKERLVGFTQEWEGVRLGDLGELARGKGVSKSNVVEIGYPFISYGEIYTIHNIKIKEYRTFINAKGRKESFRMYKGDIVFTGSGESANEIGKAVAFLFDDEAYAGGDTIVLTQKSNDSLFLTYMLNSNHVINQLASLGQGNSVVHIYPFQLAQISFPLPPHPEQIAIAKILSTADHEIDLYEKQLEELKKQKKALMQLLLTGIVRVNVEKVI